VPTFQIESTFKGLVAGMDEVGRGPWAGPTVAAVALFLEPLSLSPSLANAIQDSKKLPKAKREELYEKLTTLKPFCYGIGVATVEEIDRLNILKAIFLAMERALEALPQKPSTLLIDGKHVPSFKGIESHPLIGGDNLSLSIAAASIIAKVTRDRLMEDLARTFPHYGWDHNAGYGTAEHQEALKVHGITPHHRRSFAPIKALLLESSSST